MSLYLLKSAINNIWREKWINLLCTITIATGLFILSFSMLLLKNINSAASRLPERFTMTAFISDEFSTEQARGVVREITAMPEVREAAFISKDEALNDLREILQDADNLLRGLDGNPLPASVEIKLRKSAFETGSADDIAGKIKGMRGIEDVQFGKELLLTIQTIRRNSEKIGITFILLLSSGIMFVIYSTVKIMLYRKRAEIDTMKMLGATRTFIKTPYILEGGIIGFTGGVLCSFGLLALNALVFYSLASYMPAFNLLKSSSAFIYLPPVAGLSTGVLGAFIALGKIRF